MKRGRFTALLIAAMVFAAVPQANPIPDSGIVAEAHGGRTDSNGGHHDNKNKSGLGSYHYHCGGHPAHLHTNGVCPYAPQSSTNNKTNSKTTKQTQPETTAAPEPETTQAEHHNQCGWQKDDIGWWYLNEDGTYPKSGWWTINKKDYCFDDHGYLYTDTTTPDGCHVDENGECIH